MLGWRVFGTIIIGAQGLLYSCMIRNWRRLLLFLRDFYDHSIRLGSKDTMVWVGSNNGNFSIKFNTPWWMGEWSLSLMTLFGILGSQWRLASLLRRQPGAGFWPWISLGGVGGFPTNATCAKKKKKRVITFFFIEQKHVFCGSWFLLCLVYNG